jgi:hypothetical protein
MSTGKGEGINCINPFPRYLKKDIYKIFTITITTIFNNDSSVLNILGKSIRRVLKALNLSS